MKVEFYEKSNGEKPALDFILSLDKKTRAKIAGAVELLKLKGHELRPPFSKKISKNIFELRCEYNSNQYRVLYFFVVDNKAYLTNGFIKKAMATPIREIERAERYRNDYLARRG